MVILWLLNCYINLSGRADLFLLRAGMKVMKYCMVFDTACYIQWPLVLKKLERANRAFSHDVMSAILMY